LVKLAASARKTASYVKAGLDKAEAITHLH
jgi:hypothetical protein